MARIVYTQTASACAVALSYDADEIEQSEEWFAANPLYTIRLLNKTSGREPGAPSVYLYKLTYRAKKANRDDLNRRFTRAFGRGFSVVEPFAEITDRVPYAAA